MRLEKFFRGIGTVTMKLTMGCNLKCTYCNTETVTPQTPMMSLDLYKQVATLLVENSRYSVVNLEFHGGEPMLLDDDWLEEASGYARELARKHHKRIELPLVTNGTLLSQERLDRLHKCGIRFCLSCDGPPRINDIFRGSGHAVQRAIELFRENGVYVGIMTVISRANYSRMYEVMDWYREIGVPDFRVNFIQPQGRGLDSDLLNSEEMFDSARQIFDHMYETNVSVLEAELLSHIERFVEGRDPNPTQTCWEFQCQAGRSYVAVDLFGRIHACGSDVTNHEIGHIDHDLDEEFYQRTMATLHHKGDWAIRCFDCPAQRICNHSCPTSDFNDMRAKENECAYTKLLWKHFCANPDKVRRVYEITSRARRCAPRNFVPLEDLAYSSAEMLPTVSY